MKILEIDGKRFQLEMKHGRFYLHRFGQKIAELINGQAGLDKQYKGLISKWVEKIRKRDLERIYSIDYQKVKIEQERENLVDRWDFKV